MKRIIFSLFLWASILLVSVSSDLASDRAALVALRSAVGGRSLLWNLSSSPCNWTGVNCFQNRVVELRLPGMGLSGQLPIAIGNLTQLQTLSLRLNVLSGSIPSDFAKLSTLRNLYLQGNGFSEGKVVRKRRRDFGPSKQPEIEILRDGVVKNDGKSNGNKKLVFFGKASRAFYLHDLLKASAEILGKGTFGTVYKATLDQGVAVVVKRLKDVTVSEKEFKEKMEVVGAMVHQNLVPLRAYYFSGDEKLLVYSYMPMGSLTALLHGNGGAGRTRLNWETRSNIALGAARGIAYLHSKGSGVSHGNIKSSNILLTASHEACVSDFGLAQLSGPGRTSTPNRVDGYRAPEVTDARKISQKADVYSFGVLLLELLARKAPAHTLTNDGVDLPRWVQSVVEEEWRAEVFDLELLRYENVEEDMVQLGLPLTALLSIQINVRQWTR